MVNPTALTADKPIQPGWYWYEVPNWDPFPIEVVDQDGVLMVYWDCADDQRVSELNGRWAGPLEVPR